MATLWFWLVAVMLAGYVVFDGFDLGAGILHLHAGRSPDERRAIIRSIGAVWDGNEVWLLAAGGTLYCAFPALYAVGFSGFYLPLMIVLWLLILRGAALEFRGQIDSPAWRPFWDVVFSASSLLLAVFFGAALGNVVRGVPIDDRGYFFEPLWTDFRTGPETGVIDWYTVLAGLTASLALARHGALWLSLKTGGEVWRRAARSERTLFYAVVLSTALLTWATFRVQPHVPARLAAAPWGSLFPALAVAGLLLSRLLASRRAEAAAFLASCAYLAGMMWSAAFGLYPYVLPANTVAARGLTVHNAAASIEGLRAALWWWIPGMILVAIYFTVLYRHVAGKVRLDQEGY